VFPACTVLVEGHTDSHGSDELNQKLSQERADAVKQYILANMDLPPSSIDAAGFGESKPIASNETPEGREKNRRIDLVITPNLGSMTNE
jgi:OOP family OmpA-OmpF porin